MRMPDELRTNVNLAYCPCEEAYRIMTTRIAGGLLKGITLRRPARLKTPAFTVFRPDCP